MAPAISPGKSWEGFFGGTIVAVFVPFLLVMWVLTGATLRLAVNPAGFHFFDPETGMSLAAAAEERTLQTA